MRISPTYGFDMTASVLRREDSLERDDKVQNEERLPVLVRLVVAHAWRHRPGIKRLSACQGRRWRVHVLPAPRLHGEHVARRRRGRRAVVGSHDCMGMSGQLVDRERVYSLSRSFAEIHSAETGATAEMDGSLALQVGQPEVHPPVAAIRGP